MREGLGRVYASRSDYAMDVVKADVAFASSDAADVGAIARGQMGELIPAESRV